MSKWFSRWVSLSCLRQWLSDKIVETLYSNRATTENKRIHTPPPPLHSKLGCLLFSIGSSNSGTTLHSALLIIFIIFQVFGIEVEKFIWKFAIILIGLLTLIEFLLCNVIGTQKWCKTAKTIALQNLGRFPFVRTDRPDHSHHNENCFPFNQNYPGQPDQSNLK